MENHNQRHIANILRAAPGNLAHIPRRIIVLPKILLANNIFLVIGVPYLEAVYLQVVAKILFQFLQTAFGYDRKAMLGGSGTLGIAIPLHYVLFARTRGLLHLAGGAIVSAIEEMLHKIDGHSKYALAFLISQQCVITIYLLKPFFH